MDEAVGQGAAGARAWDVEAIRAPAVWSRLGDIGRGVTVGMIDTGVDPAHPALAGRIAGWRDFVGGRAEPYDDNGHGTHGAGTIAGGAPGRAVGVAPGARLLVAKALDSSNVGSGSALLARGSGSRTPTAIPPPPTTPASSTTPGRRPTATAPGTGGWSAHGAAWGSRRSSPRATAVRPRAASTPRPATPSRWGSARPTSSAAWRRSRPGGR